MTRIHLVDGDATEVLPEALAAVADQSTLVILDPPRTGLEKSALELLATQGPEHMIYVSCAPDTLARDIKRLREAGYSLVETGVIDMFPRTAAFESVTCLRRKTAT